MSLANFLHATLLLWPALFPAIASQSVKCTVPSVEKGETMALTCDFGVDMRTVKSKVTVERGEGQAENIVECRYFNEKYVCTVHDQKFGISPNITRFFRVYLPNVNKQAESRYHCKRQGHTDFPNPCEFVLKEPEGPMVEEGWKWAAVSLIILSIILIIVLVVMIVCCFFAD